MSSLDLHEEKLAINHCVNCCCYHPDEFPTINDYIRRLVNPQKDIWVKQIQFGKKWHLYANKSCALCGRSYDHNGELDESWKITAKRVKEELNRAGIFGVDDKKVELIVAQCRKSVVFLFRNRMSVNPIYWDRFTFAGTLALIITGAQDARSKKLNPSFTGPVGGKK